MPTATVYTKKKRKTQPDMKTGEKKPLSWQGKEVPIKREWTSCPWITGSLHIKPPYAVNKPQPIASQA